MTLNAILHYSASCFCVGMAVFVLLRDRRSFSHLFLAPGMIALALEAFFTGLSIEAVLSEQAIRWQHWRFSAAALVPCIWLLFGLSFAQESFWPLRLRWKWVVVLIFVLHLVFVSLLRTAFFEGAPVYLTRMWEFKLGWSGYGFHVCFLLSLILIMMVLERILRASMGRKRWQVKFLILGVGGLFAVRLYTSSHSLVFHAVNLEFEVINAVALLTANLLILISVLRSGTLQLNIYLSQKVLYNSLTLIVVGVYFLALGLSIQTLNRFLSVPLQALLIFVALLGLLVVLFSARLRLEMKHFVSRYFRRPHYDYRKVWTDFTAKTAALVEEKPLCEAVAKMLSEMFDMLSVSIWLPDAKQKLLRCGASTALSGRQACDLPDHQIEAADLMQLFPKETNFLDIEDPKATSIAALKRVQVEILRNARIRYVVPLLAGGNFIGIISLGDPVKETSLSSEEVEMLRTIADQVAAILLNIKLYERLHQAKEMEAFQTIAAFFVHDLKNLASKLSMMFKNLPVHFDKPAFRDDALRLMSQSVTQIDGMCSQLSLLREKLEIRPVEIDLNQLVAATLAELNGFPAGCLMKDLQPVPKVTADPEQIQKVLTNLILNAGDAVGEKGEICISTVRRDGWVELGVSDTGCGIPKEFMNECLFRPFKSTKSQGTGIGLFQSKMIVEAHNGVIEVESQEERGSTFRVLLPMKLGER